MTGEASRRGAENRAASGNAPRWFVLQGTDPVTRCPLVESRFLVADPSALLSVLRDPQDPDLRNSHVLTPAELAAIKRVFGASLDVGALNVRLQPWHEIREAPYLVHTGCELAMMLEGRKPFAQFSDAYPSAWFDDLIGPFAPFVEAGRIVSYAVDHPFEMPRMHSDGTMSRGIRHVFFALPGEEWRIKARLLLARVTETSGWNEALERYEGSLLGYEDWQNDWWIAWCRRRVADRQSASSQVARRAAEPDCGDQPPTRRMTASRSSPDGSAP